MFDGNTIQLLSISLQYVSAQSAGNTESIVSLERKQFLEGSALVPLFSLSDLVIASPFDDLYREDKHSFLQGRTHSKGYADIGLIFMTKNGDLLL